MSHRKPQPGTVGTRGPDEQPEPPFEARYSVAFAIEIPRRERLSAWWPAGVDKRLFKKWRRESCHTGDGYQEHVYGAVLDFAQFDALVTETGVTEDGESMGILNAAGCPGGIVPAVVLVDGDNYRVTVCAWPADVDPLAGYHWPDEHWRPMVKWLERRYGDG